MHNFFFLVQCVLFAFSSSYSIARVNVCPTSSVINRPVNSQPVYWPSTWTESQPAPDLESNQSCGWTVNVPKGYYAKLIISGKMNDNKSKFQTIDTAGNVIQTTEEGMQPYYFPSSKFSIIVSNQSPATFGFKIVWLPFPKVANKYIALGLEPEVANVTKSVYTYGYSAVTGVSLLAFPQNQNDYYSLRSSLIIEGSRMDGHYASNLWLLYQTNNQWISSGESILVVNLEASNKTDTLLVQEAGYTKDIASYVELIPISNSTYSRTVNGGEKKSALVSVSGINETMIAVEVDDAATVKIYYGSQNDFSYSETYSGSQLKQSLPRSFLDTVVQYVVSSGKAVFTFKS